MWKNGGRIFLIVGLLLVFTVGIATPTSHGDISSFSSSSTTYTVGEHVTLQGYSASTLVGVQVDDPHGTPLLIATVRTTDNVFIKTFKLPMDASDGLYVATATDDNGKAHAYFLVVSTRITSADAVDQEGRVKVTFKPGEVVLTAASVENLALTPRKFLFAIQWLKPDGTLLPTFFVSTTVESGKTFMFAPGLALPADAEKGTWTFEVNVFDNFPAQGGKIKAVNRVGSFTVA